MRLVSGTADRLGLQGQDLHIDLLVHGLHAGRRVGLAIRVRHALARRRQLVRQELAPSLDRQAAELAHPALHL